MSSSISWPLPSSPAPIPLLAPNRSFLNSSRENLKASLRSLAGNPPQQTVSFSRHTSQRLNALCLGRQFLPI